MAINYPNSPTTGQEFKIGNKTLVYSGSKWVPSTRNYYQYGTELATTGSTLDIDLSKSNIFSIAATQQSIISFTNPPTTGSYTFTVKVTNNNTPIVSGTTSTWDIRNISAGTTYTLPTIVSETSLSSLAVKSDGTVAFFTGGSQDRVYQINMSSSPWNFGTGVATYSGNSLSFGSGFAGETNPTDLYVDPTGSNLFVIGTTLSTVFRYTLPTPWSLVGVSTTATSSFGVTGASSVFFKPDGSVMYILDTANKLVYQHPLTGSAFDITQRGTQVIKILPIETAVSYVRFKPDGTKMYLYGETNDQIHQYNLSTPWDIATASYDAIVGKVFATSVTSGGSAFKSEGDYVFTLNRTNQTLQQSSISAFTYANILTWPSNVIWQNNVAPDLPKNQKTSLYEFTTVDGGSTYHGKIIINNV